MLRNSRNIVLFLAVLIWPCQAFSQDNIAKKAAALIQQNQYNEAITCISENANAVADKADLYYFRGIAYYHTGDMELALHDFEMVNITEKHKADIWIARIYGLQGDSKNTLNYLTALFASSYRINESLVKKDTAFDPIQSTDEWFEFWQEDRRTMPEKLQDEIDYYLSRQKIFEALEIINTALKYEPNNFDLYALRGHIYMEQGNVKGAIQDYNLAENSMKNSASLYDSRARAYVKNKNYGKAIEDYRKALRLEPYNFSNLLGLAESYAGNEQLDEATRSIEEYLVYFPENPEAIALSGDIQYQAGNYLAALKYYNINLRNTKDNPEYYKSRGKAYIATSMHKYALKDFSMALDLNPVDPELYLNAGIAQLKLGQKEKACSSWRKAATYGNKKALEYLIEYCRED